MPFVEINIQEEIEKRKKILHHLQKCGMKAEKNMN